MRLVRVTRVLAVALTSGVLIGGGPAGAKGAGGPGTNGTASGTSTVTGLPGTDAAATRYSVFRGESSSSVSAINTNGGSIEDQRQIAGRWALPAVTLRGDPGGLSADGDRLVLMRPRLLDAQSTSFRFLDTSTLRTRDEVTFDGRWLFDAISPDGSLVYLIEYPRPGNFVEYRVRAYVPRKGELRPGAVVDPDEAGEPMTGEPVSRAMSPDGRWAYTLYRGEETFVHALDTQEAEAVCIDLPQLEDANFFALDLSVDPSSGALTVLDRGEPAVSIDPETFQIDAVSDTGTAEAGGDGDWLIWAMVGAGLVLYAAALAILRRRRHRAAAAESELEAALREDAVPEEVEEPRTREPVA